MKIIGITAHKQTNIFKTDMTTLVRLLIGNGTNGLSQHYYEISDNIASIPMSEQPSASSLNVSCAATVMFYGVNRQRHVSI